MDNIDFRRNKETGILECWQNNKKIGEILTMGDLMREKHAGSSRGKSVEK